MQKILKPEKLIVLVDDRESDTTIAEHLQEKRVLVKFVRLDVGDYIISENVCVERKTANDFVKSIIDGRVFQQVQAMKSNYAKAILIIEDGSYKSMINENAVKAAIASLLLKYDASIIMTKNQVDTAKTIYWLIRKEQEAERNSLVIKGKKKPKGIKELQEDILSSFPGISTVLSKRLLEYFKSIKAVMNASEDDLLKIQRINKNQAKKIHALLNETYEADR